MKRLVLSAAVASLIGCTNAPLYTGDGRFIDNGTTAYSKRYVIDLGPVDLSKPGLYTYTLSGLPRAEFAVNIRVTEEDRNTWETERSYPAIVRMLLQNEENQAAIEEVGSLNYWVRGYGQLDNSSDLYRRGESRDFKLAGGGTRSERVGVKVSGGWGTYFYSEQHKAYKLTLEILESSMNKPARIILNGWPRA